MPKTIKFIQTLKVILDLYATATLNQDWAKPEGLSRKKATACHQNKNMQFKEMNQNIDKTHSTTPKSLKI